MATERGLIKKTLLSEFSRPRSNGIIAIDLLPADRLIGVAITDGRARGHAREQRGAHLSFPRAPGALHGPQRPWGHRHADLRTRADHLPHRRRRGHGAHRYRERLRQVHPDGRVSAQGARRQGRHLHSHRRAQRRGHRCARGRTERRDHAHDRRRQAGAHPGCRGQRAGAQYAGSEAHPPRFRRAARGRGARHRGRRRATATKTRADERGGRGRSSGCAAWTGAAHRAPLHHRGRAHRGLARPGPQDARPRG